MGTLNYLKSTPLLKYIGWISFVWIFVQMPDIKVYGIKPIELLGALFLIVYIRKVTLSEILLISYFTFFLLLTLYLNQFIEFPAQKFTGFIRQPYYITFARYLEYLSCIGVVLYVKREVERRGVLYVVKSLLIISVLVELCILGLYVLEIYGNEFIDIAYFTNGALRMKGFFVEGGPFGLYNAFLLILTLIYIKSAKRYYLVPFFLVFIILGQSKAGYVALLIWLIVWIFIYVKQYFKSLVFRFLTYWFLILSFVLGFYLISFSYVNSLSKKQELMELVKSDPDHFWISGGRIPGFYILQEMFFDKPFLGIGMGNYQLLRNSDCYRDFMPETRLWDNHGYGGFVEILNQFGAIGFLMFCFLLFIVFRPISSNYYLLFIFIVPLCLGLSLHFHYVWIVVGIVIPSVYYKG